ncbi:deoxyguanosinetriphosphate triphosphohydrolase [Pacificimonas sp. WHA3]|uniref:Deoxyguanosinetriphosphate triphosphohydrolase-like protein n=1 Tax=Pacificimonas pallii TaxID=2827236 RepID=A0ABS6SCX4_9SPHN|nr:deoxyguanosinetriphosphate triphosphohydrolase [Pacificimonas pallii]MBV7256265.1 deoxyguanosinetriphosphate triphosphohydrolase [Pacificimonas pallii]
MLFPYACHPGHSRGRLHPANPSALRDAFARDRDRIVHSSGFRRLKHKTQVFVAPDGDHFRTRLTHSLEVAQIGRVMAKALGVHEALTEAICLAHDLGHPPFGHVGEDALNVAMADYGGFDHNAHTLRVLCTLESAYAAHDGLNLSWEVLEGLAKHNGPVTAPTWALQEIDTAFPLDLETHASLEAQIAALADDIAYDNHDFEDGLRAGLFSLDQALEVDAVRENWEAVRARYPDAPQDRLIAEMKRRQIGLMVEDVLRETKSLLAALSPRTAGDIRGAGRQTAAFSAPMAAAEREIKSFLYANMYHHPASIRPRDRAAALVGQLFEDISRTSARLPESWEATLPAENPARARHIGDFIAGMTDRYAQRFGGELQLEG